MSDLPGLCECRQWDRGIPRHHPKCSKSEETTLRAVSDAARTYLEAVEAFELHHEGYAPEEIFARTRSAKLRLVAALDALIRRQL